MRLFGKRYFWQKEKHEKTRRPFQQFKLEKAPGLTIFIPVFPLPRRGGKRAFHQKFAEQSHRRRFYAHHIADAPPVHKGRNGRGDKIRDGLGVKGGHAAEHGGQHKQRHKVHQLAEKREGQGVAHHAHAGEAVDHRVLQRQRDHAQGADADGPGRQRRHLRVFGEDAHKGPGRKLPGKAQKGRVANAQQQDVLLRLEDAVRPARPVIEAQDRPGAAGDTAQRHGDHQHEALGDGGGGHQHVALGRAAVFLQEGVQGNDHDIVDRDNGEGGEAQRRDPPHDPKIVLAEGDAHLSLIHI